MNGAQIIGSNFNNLGLTSDGYSHWTVANGMFEGEWDGFVLAI
jgi:hypothetical protein